MIRRHLIFFNDTATTEIYTLSLHDALPIFNPCNLNLRALAEEVRTGILEAGGIPFEAPLMSLSENIIKPTSFPFRNLLSMEAEECIRAYPFDAVVLLGGCEIGRAHV